MLRYLITIMVVLSINSNAGILDFITLDKAKEYYKKGEYKKAIKSYNSSSNTTQQLIYNRACAYYKNTDYKSAIKGYKSISDKSLKPKALHNLGNTYVKLKEYDKAIKSYEEALRLKYDKDTEYNLQQLKEQKRLW